MVGNIISFPISGISATYDGQKGKLKLTAAGRVPGVMLDPMFQRDDWLGGLKYSLTAFFTGLGGPRPDRDISVSYEESMVLPKRSFNNTSVLIETSAGVNEVPIKYLNTPAPPNPTSNPTPAANPKPDSSTGANSNTSANTGGKAPTPSGPNLISTQLLAPIEMWLPKDKPLKISATISKDLDLGSSTSPKFNSKYLQLVDASIRENVITWTFQWAKVPDADVATPMVEITTSVLNPKTGPDARTVNTIQGYVIHSV